MRGTCGVHASLRVNVKHGDNLRTLGGAMTAQRKVLHLLLSQSDNSKIECRITRSVFVSFPCVELKWENDPPDPPTPSYVNPSSVSPLLMVWTGYWFLCFPRHIITESITISNSHFLNLKAHTQCCSHCLTPSTEHVVKAAVLHWRNTFLDTRHS